MKTIKVVLVAAFMFSSFAAPAQEIFEAIKSKDLAKVKILIEKGADVNTMASTFL